MRIDPEHKKKLLINITQKVKGSFHKNWSFKSNSATILLLTLFILISCDNKEQKSLGPNFGNYDPNNYQNIIVKHYKNLKLVEEGIKYTFESPRHRPDILLLKILYTYDINDSLSQIQRLHYGNGMKIIDTVTEKISYHLKDNMIIQSKTNLQGDTISLFTEEKISRTNDNLFFVKEINKYYESDSIRNENAFIKVYQDSTLINIYTIGSNQDTIATEILVYNEACKLLLDYTLDEKKDTSKYFKYIYKDNQLEYVKGFMNQVMSNVVETYGANSKISSKTYYDEFNKDTVKFFFKYNQNNLLKTTYWNYNNLNFLIETD